MRAVGLGCVSKWNHCHIWDFIFDTVKNQTARLQNTQVQVVILFVGGRGSCICNPFKVVWFGQDWGPHIKNTALVCLSLHSYSEDLSVSRSLLVWYRQHS